MVAFGLIFKEAMKLKTHRVLVELECRWLLMITPYLNVLSTTVTVGID